MEKELKKGTVGEYITWNLFIKMETIKSVVDVRDDEFFRSVDVDFLVEDVKRQFSWVEVKTDSMAHRTGNLAYETYSSKKYQTIGCLEKTKAKYVAYYIPEANLLHILNADRLRKFAHSGRYKLINMGDDASGYLIPITDLKKEKIIMVTYKT